jgi:DNA-binding IclR family transcriptional regulator
MGCVANSSPPTPPPAPPSSPGPPSSPDPSQAGTVDKAVDILFHLHGCADARGVTSIARDLGLPKSSAHRLVTTLLRRGLLEQDTRGRYRPGIGLVALGLGALEREPVVVAARTVLEQEAEALGETFFLVGQRAQEIVVLDKVEGTGFLRAAPRVGSSVPVHATAVGKLYLAFAPTQVAFPAGTLEAFTSQTAVDSGALRAAVAETKLRRWASNRDEWIPGLSVLAAPVLSPGRTTADRMIAAVALAMPSPRLEEFGEEPLARRVVAAGARIASRLEGSGR